MAPAPIENHAGYAVLMAFACLVPLAFIFVLPLFGISSTWATASALVLMVVLHFTLMKDHFSDSRGQHKSGAS